MRPDGAQPLHRAGHPPGVGQGDLDPGIGQLGELVRRSAEEIGQSAPDLAQRPGHGRGDTAGLHAARRTELDQGDGLDVGGL